MLGRHTTQRQRLPIDALLSSPELMIRRAKLRYWPYCCADYPKYVVEAPAGTVLVGSTRWSGGEMVRLTDSSGQVIAFTYMPEVHRGWAGVKRFGAIFAATARGEVVRGDPDAIVILDPSGRRLGGMQYEYGWRNDFVRHTGAVITTDRGVYSARVTRRFAEIKMSGESVCRITKLRAPWYQRIGRAQWGPCRMELKAPQLVLEERVVFVAAAMLFDAWRFWSNDASPVDDL
ncbi:MAG: hypothetical protein HY908_30370 [Myxococcales bacterium]|nr:hypothetical protein [Myxococcales bacterium]